MLDFVHPISAEGGAARSTGSAGTTNPAGNSLRNMSPELVCWSRQGKPFPQNDVLAGTVAV